MREFVAGVLLVEFVVHFHAVSVSRRVRHPLSYPKDFCDLFFNDNFAELADYHW